MHSYVGNVSKHCVWYKRIGSYQVYTLKPTYIQKSSRTHLMPSLVLNANAGFDCVGTCSFAANAGLTCTTGSFFIRFRSVIIIFEQNIGSSQGAFLRRTTLLTHALQIYTCQNTPKTSPNCIRYFKTASRKINTTSPYRRDSSAHTCEGTYLYAARQHSR